MRPVVGHFYLLVLAFLKFEYNEVQATGKSTKDTDESLFCNLTICEA